MDTFEALLTITNKENKPIYQFFQEFEAENSEITVQDVRNKIKEALSTIYSTIKQGLNSTELSESGLSGGDAVKIKERYLNNKTSVNALYAKLIGYAIAIMEQNIRMGRIVACPTAGSCGIVTASIAAYSEELNIPMEKQIDALIVASGIGKIVAQKVALAGAVAGCQAECGVAGAMAAGAIVELLGGSNEQIVEAAALSLKNLLGLSCDPVAGLVEIPCIKRNAFIAIHAQCASELALAGLKSAIPLDEVIDAMKQTGLLMSPLIKESSEGGLAVTKTGLEIAEKLNEKWFS